MQDIPIREYPASLFQQDDTKTRIALLSTLRARGGAHIALVLVGRKSRMVTAKYLLAEQAVRTCLEKKPWAKLIVDVSGASYGEALCQAANSAGLKARIYAPEWIEPARVRRIKGEGGEAFCSYLEPRLEEQFDDRSCDHRYVLEQPER